MPYTRVRIFTRRSFAPSRKAGSIIVFTMWVLVFFSILSVSIYRLVYAQLNLARAIEERGVSPYLASAACKHFQYSRIKNPPAWDTLFSLQKKNELKIGRLNLSYSLEDEESKININKVTADVLARVPGLDSELASAIARSSFKPFHFKEELLLMDEITQEIFNACKDYITVFGNGQVNINTAPFEVLRALGMNDSLCDKISSFRAGLDGLEATADDLYFENIAQVPIKLREYQGLSSAEEEELSGISGLTVKGENFCIRVDTAVSSRQAMHYRITLDTNSIKQWKEN